MHLHAGLGSEQNVPEVGNRIHSLTYTCNKRYGVHVMIYSGFRCGTLSVTSLKAELTLESANADMPTQPHLQGPSRYGPDNPKKKHNELECNTDIVHRDTDINQLFLVDCFTSPLPRLRHAGACNNWHL